MYFTSYFAALTYVITGGPASGKTSIIKELEKQGEIVIHEVATDFIISKINAGVPAPWKDETFQLDILNLQLEREAPCDSIEGRVFADRGLFDGYAYVMSGGLAGTQTLACINEILSPIDLNQRYEAVFFVLPYGTDFPSRQTEVFRENGQEAAKLEAAVHAIYCRHKNFIEVPGGMSPRERADFILERIRNYTQTTSKVGF